MDELLVARLEAGQVEQLVHTVHGGERQSLVQPVVQLSDLGVALGLRSRGVQHQVFRQHLEVQVAEKRHGGHGSRQLIDEVGCRRGTADRITQGRVEEEGCGA
ncbi:hypothetical protein [Streptomyces bauhiniae]|uniref:hypothetical protein n=1 Tax=Streptomyces bauhiniae TaxID=2340725 RepID=UPI0033BE6294